ncbi:MAG: HAMP domain-containing protein [Burkholderiales bacterium]|jgi:nitrogen fixation/metabolism regulation signal transduction histidine kinase|nr:HAMP domain-containing protein [Burkholderiales bacterium]
MSLNRKRLSLWGLVFAAAGSVVAFFFLARASADSSLVGRNLFALIALNAVLIFLLLFVVARHVFLLYRAWRRGVFGSKLAMRLTILGAFTALVPSIFVYMASIHFLGYSIESWFDVRIDRALDGGLKVSRSALDTRLNETLSKARVLANSLAVAPFTYGYGLELNRITEQANVEEAAIFSSAGVLLAVGGTRPTVIEPKYPTQIELRAAIQSGGLADIKETKEGDAPNETTTIRLRALVPIESFQQLEPVRFLQVIDSVPQALVTDIETLHKGWSDYEEIAHSRQGTKNLYTLTLTMALLLTLAFTLAITIVLSERFADSLGLLAAGTRAVAGGDFSVRQPVMSEDELGSLTASFNAMTEQLAQAERERKASLQALETTRAHLESVLVNLSSGVLVFDAQKKLQMVNNAAAVILQAPLFDMIGVPLDQWSGKHAELSPFVSALSSFVNDDSGVKPWHADLNLMVHNAPRAIILRGAKIVGAQINDVVVVDDVTPVVHAQRDAAWSEVARRLAHEIKNPLTPIQLSAERLQKKLKDQLKDADRDFLDRSTQTIVSQVGAMKNMVDDFSMYARQTRASQEIDLNLGDLLTETTHLYEYLRPNLRLHLPEAPVWVHGEPVRLRQVFHNLLQNAIDAQAGVDDPLYEISVKAHENTVEVAFDDNGHGFPKDMLSRAFEPYVTTKAKGTGLGLAIVKKIVEEHNGNVTIVNREPRGSRVILVFPIYTGATNG